MPHGRTRQGLPGGQGAGVGQAQLGHLSWSSGCRSLEAAGREALWHGPSAGGGLGSRAAGATASGRERIALRLALLPEGALQEHRAAPSQARGCREMLAGRQALPGPPWACREATLRARSGAQRGKEVAQQLHVERPQAPPGVQTWLRLSGPSWIPGSSHNAESGPNVLYGAGQNYANLTPGEDCALVSFKAESGVLNPDP